LTFLTRSDIAIQNGVAMGFTPALKQRYLPPAVITNTVSYPPPLQLDHSEFYHASISGDALRNAIFFAVLK
jgi:hypothetical protein